MPLLALAVLGGSYYQARQQKKASEQARLEASRQNAAASEQAKQTLAQQKETNAIAREKLTYEVEKNKEDKAKLESESKKIADQMEAENKALAEQEMTRIKNMRRSGSRALLSDTRLNPELGLGGGADSFGSGMSL
jgi:membrane protein involved in colicin uptake